MFCEEGCRGLDKCVKGWIRSKSWHWEARSSHIHQSDSPERQCSLMAGSYTVLLHTGGA
jgi:hypothetical protein